VFFELVKNSNKHRGKTISASLKFSTEWYFELFDVGSLKFYFEGGIEHSSRFRAR